MRYSLTSKQKIILLVAGGVGLYMLLALFCIAPGKKGCGEVKTGAELVMWGVFDGEEIWEPITRSFKLRNINTKITYKQIPFADYEKRLIDAFASGTGPDIFFINNTWLPKFQNKMTPMPQGQGWMTFSQYRDSLVDVAVSDFTRDRQEIYAVPFNIDTLALYYNRDLFNSAGIAEPPRTWEEFQKNVERLTLIDSAGSVIRSGAAMGTARNINRSTDVMGLLMLQTFGDTPLVDVEGSQTKFTISIGEGGNVFTPGLESLRFYTDFANPALKSYTWNRDQHYSIDAFVEGNTAMMLNYSHHIETIRSRAPQLSLGIARAPQPQALYDQKKAIDYAGYFGLAVARTDNERKAAAAWEFLQYMTEAPQQKVYFEATRRLPARRDLLAQLTEDPDFGVFAQQALTARSWYQPDNVAVETIFADMIESVIDGTSAREALQRADGEISVLLRDADLRRF